jgi:hypothetical protein
MLKKTILGAAAMLLLALPTLAQESLSSFTARIAYAHNDRLYVVNPGGDTPLIVDETPTYAYYAVWSPDGTKLAYLTSADGEAFSDMKTLKVWDGTQSTEIVSNFKSPAGMPINWTRDGKLLYFVGNDQYTEEGLLIEMYTVDPVAGATPELVSNQVPLGVGCGGGSSIPMDWAAWEETDLGRSRAIVGLTDYGLIYPSFCAGSRTALFRTFSNELTPFAAGQLQRPALSPDERSLAGITTAETGETQLIVANLETMEERTQTTAHPVSQLTWGADGSLYYSSVTESANMLAGLTEEQLRTFSTALGFPTDMPAETKMAHNTVSVYRIAPDGTETPVFEGLDANEIGRMQVVGNALYFSIVTNGDEWVKAIVDGTLSLENNFETADDYIHTHLYAIDLVTPNATPTLLIEDAAQFAAAGQ